MPSSDNLTININMRNVDFETYHKLHEWKKRGNFASWDALIEWLVKTFGGEIDEKVGCHNDY